MKHGFFRSALGGAALTILAQTASSRLDPQAFKRVSYSGKEVSLTGGLAVSAGTILAGLPALNTREGRAACLAGIVGGLSRAVDDHFESAFSASGKGFAGHIGALKQGKVTSGLVKLGAISGGALASSLLLGSGAQSKLGRSADIAINAALIAAMANFINLLDLRPGRALKIVALGGIGHGPNKPSRVTTGALTGGALAALPDDLAGKTMLGDLGANALGAQLGVALAASPFPAARVGILAVVTALTALSEKVSFSEIIDSTPVLAQFDAFGRRA